MLSCLDVAHPVPRATTPRSSPISEYEALVVRSFAALKSSAGQAVAQERAIPIEGGMGTLVPVGYEHVGDDRLIATLARWREANMHVYPTQFPVTHSGTAEWLTERVLAVSDRVLFLVVEPGGRPLGHGGFAEGARGDRSLKLDNVMRGEAIGPPGIMTGAVGALLRWADATLASEVITAPAFADNHRIIRLLCGLGFRDEGDLIPLQKVVSGDRIDYVPHDSASGRPPDRYQNRLIYRTSTPD
jgi:RimJ/RimL family protein N-acetyltransferase